MKIRVLFILLTAVLAAALADPLSQLTVFTPRITTKIEAVSAILPWNQAVNMAGLNDSLQSTYRFGLGKIYIPADNLAERGIVAVRTSTGNGSVWVTPDLCRDGYEASNLDKTTEIQLAVTLSPAVVVTYSPSILADDNPRLLFRASPEKTLAAENGKLKVIFQSNALTFVQAVDPATKSSLWWRIEDTSSAVSVIPVAADNLLSAGDINADGKITVADATLALRAAVGLIILSPEQASRADVTDDGKVTTADATKLLRLSLGLQ